MTINASVSGGTPPYTYLWTPSWTTPQSTNTYATSTTLSFTPAAIGNHFTSLVVTDAQGRQGATSTSVPIGGLPSGSLPDVPQSFRDCLTTGTTDCELPANGPTVYSVRSTLLIERPNVNILGHSITLLRDCSNQSELVKTNGPLSNVFISGFIFDGNYRTCGEIAAGADVDIGECTNCLVYANGFSDSPNIGLSVDAIRARNVTVLENVIYFSHHHGIYSGAFIPGTNPTRYCGVSDGERCDCGGSATQPCLTVSNNFILFSGVNGMLLYSTWANINDNVLVGNHNLCLAVPPAPGGQIDLETGTQNITLVRNRLLYGGWQLSGGNFSAPTNSSCNGWWAQGLEIHGTQIHIESHDIEYNAGEGIFMDAPNGVEVYNTPGTLGPNGWLIRQNGQLYPATNQASQYHCEQFPAITIHTNPSKRATSVYLHDLAIEHTLYANDRRFIVNVTNSIANGPPSGSDNVTLANICRIGSTGIPIGYYGDLVTDQSSNPYARFGPTLNHTANSNQCAW